MHRPGRGGNSGRFADEIITTGATPLLRAAGGTRQSGRAAAAGSRKRVSTCQRDGRDAADGRRRLRMDPAALNPRR